MRSLESFGNAITECRFSLTNVSQYNIAKVLFAMPNLKNCYLNITPNISDCWDRVRYDELLKELEGRKFNYMKHVERLEIDAYSAPTLNLFRNCKSLKRFVLKIDNFDFDGQDPIDSFLLQQKKLQYLTINSTDYSEIILKTAQWLKFRFKLKKFATSMIAFDVATVPEFLKMQSDLEKIDVFLRIEDMANLPLIQNMLRVIADFPKLQFLRFKYDRLSFYRSLAISPESVPDWHEVDMTHQALNVRNDEAPYFDYMNTVQRIHFVGSALLSFSTYFLNMAPEQRLSAPEPNVTIGNILRSYYQQIQQFVAKIRQLSCWDLFKIACGFCLKFISNIPRLSQLEIANIRNFYQYMSHYTFNDRNVGLVDVRFELLQQVHRYNHDFR